jgi:acyl-CoA thioesterase
VPDPAVENHEQLDALFREDRYAGTLGIDLEDWGGGWSRVRYRVDERHLNFTGGLHGGAIFSVADGAFSVASNSWGRIAVALSMEVHYLASPPVGTALVASAREQARTNRTASYPIEIRDDDEKLIASIHALVYRTSRWHLGEEAWSEAWRRTY